MSEKSTSTRTYAGAVFLLKFGRHLGQQSRVGLDAFLSAGKNTSIFAALVPVPVPVLVLYVSTSLKSLRYMIHASGAGQWYRTEGREGGREGGSRTKCFNHQPRNTQSITRIPASYRRSTRLPLPSKSAVDLHGGSRQCRSIVHIDLPD